METYMSCMVCTFHTITSAKEIIDYFTTKHPYFRCRHSSSITTTIYILNTRNTTTFNNHFCIIV